MMHPVISLVVDVLSLYSWLVIIYIILQWLIHFRIINAYQPFVKKLYAVLFRLTDPVLEKIRRVVPSIQGIDLSPIVLFFGIAFVQRMLIYYSF